MNSARYLLPYLNEQHHLLDVGSGAGTITADLARVVSRVTAIEIDEAALAITREYLRANNVRNVRYRVEDVQCLRFRAQEFDVIHAHQVLQHVQEPVKAISEMMRVARPGGLLAIRDAIYSDFAWAPEVPVLHEWLSLYLRLARINGGDPNAGRNLAEWAKSAGLKGMVSTRDVWRFETSQERRWWGETWARRVKESSFHDRAIRAGLASEADLRRISEGWRTWARSSIGYFVVPHGELIGYA